MRVVRRHAGVGHVAEHLVVPAQLDVLRVAIEPDLRELLADAGVPGFEILELVGGGHHALAVSAPRSLARKALKLGQMSSLRSMSTVWKLSASRRRKMLSIELS